MHALPGVRARRLALVLALAAAGCAKRSEEWIADLRNPDPFVREMAAAALARGPEESSGAAFLALAGLLDDPDEAVRERVEGALLELADRSLAAWLAEPDLAFLRRQDLGPALEATVRATLRRHAALAAPDLARRLAHDTQAYPRRVAELLGACGEAAVRPLLVLCRDERAVVRARAASALGRVGGLAEAALPELRRLAADDSPKVRAAAVEALGAIDPVRSGASPEVLAALEDPDPSVRAAAAPAVVLARVALVDALPQEERRRGLAEIAALGRTAIEALLGELASSEPGAARKAIRVLMALADSPELPPPAEPALLQEQLADPDPARRAAAAYDLARLGARAEPALPALVALLGDTDPAVRAAAAFAIGSAGRAAAPLAPELARLERDEVRWVADVARHALRMLE